MKNRVIQIGIPFLTFVFLCFMARATQRAGFPDMEGFVLEGPDTVRAGETVSWRVSVTNSQSSATRTDVSISVHAIFYSGEILFPICSFVSTNIVPPFIGTNLFYLKDDRPVSDAEIPAATEETKLIRLSTTTSVNDSGLLGYLLPMFEEAYGYEVEVFSAGTGKAIANAKMGNADLILVHAKTQEEQFVADGFSYTLDGMEAERLSYMYNYFVLCGPSEDPAGVADAEDVLAAFQSIADGKYTFISRGDNSGTHTK